MKIELTTHEQFIITTALKKEAKRLMTLGIADDEYFADKLERQKDLYKRIAGYEMELPVLLEEL